MTQRHAPPPPMPEDGVALAMALAPFHVAVLEYRDRDDGAEALRALLPSCTLLGLGHLIGPDGVPLPDQFADVRNTEAVVSLVHFISDGAEYLPLWSDPNALMYAGQTVEEWASLQPLVLLGAGIQETLSPDAWIVINPWTEVDCSIPPRRRR